MANTTVPASVAAAHRPVWLVVISAAVIVAIAMGLRQVMGLYLKPMTLSLGLGREIFGLMMAIANLVWGIGAPFAGAFGDKFGTGKVVALGAIMTICGLILMQSATSELYLMVSGILLGLGVAGTGITVLVGAAGRAAPPDKRTSAIATIGMGSGIGVLVAVPYTHVLIETMGWNASLLVLAATACVMIPLAMAMPGGASETSGEKPQSLSEALGEAFRHPSFWLLVAGFFVCGFHVSFYAVHLPAFITDKGLPSEVAMWALVVVGVGNILGTWLAGKSARIIQKRISLSCIYIGRAFIFLGILLLPTTVETVLIFSGLLGILWLSTVPLTSSMVATFFGPVWMSMLFGIVFLSHQLGSFLGVWLAGRIFDQYQSYDMVWMISIGLGIFAALVHWPIREEPVARLKSSAGTASA